MEQETVTIEQMIAEGSITVQQAMGMDYLVLWFLYKGPHQVIKGTWRRRSAPIPAGSRK